MSESHGSAVWGTRPALVVTDCDALALTQCWVAGEERPTEVQIQEPLKLGTVSREELKKRWTSKEPEPHDEDSFGTKQVS